MNKQIVMLLTNGFDPDVRVYKEAKYLSQKGCKVKILCWDRDCSLGYPERETIAFDIDIIRYKISSVAGSGFKQLIPFFKYILSCKKYLKSNRCDYLHCHDLDGALTGYLARHKSVPMIFDMHEFYERGNVLQRMFWRKLSRFMLRQSIAGLYENTAYLSSDYNDVQSKLYMLKNYPDASLIGRLPKSNSDIFRVGYHGSVRSQFIEFAALFEAVKTIPDLRVDVNGEGPDSKRLQELSKRYKNIHVHGVFNGTSALTKLYQETDVLFCGYDPTSLNYQGDAEVVKFYEAIFTGTPMVMTDRIGMAEKVKKYGFGLTCDTRDANAIREAILKLKDDKNLWKSCSENELAQAWKYDWNEAIKVLDKVYSL